MPTENAFAIIGTMLTGVGAASTVRRPEAVGSSESPEPVRLMKMMSGRHGTRTLNSTGLQSDVRTDNIIISLTTSAAPGSLRAATILNLA